MFLRLQMITLATEMRSPTYLNHGVNASAFAFFLFCVALRDVFTFTGSGALGVGSALSQSGAAWASCALVVLLAAGPWLLGRAAAAASDRTLLALPWLLGGVEHPGPGGRATSSRPQSVAATGRESVAAATSAGPTTSLQASATAGTSQLT